MYTQRVKCSNYFIFVGIPACMHLLFMICSDIVYLFIVKAQLKTEFKILLKNNMYRYLR